MAGAPVPRPWRLLGIFSVLLVALAGTVVVQGATTPRLGLDLEGGTSITLTAQTTDGQPPSQESLDEARAIIEQRVNGSGIAEAEVTTQGDTSIIVQVPGVGQDELVALVGQTAELQFRPVQ
nr:protein translocase subunit SecD [Actinomycetes bacterium]